MSKQTRMFKLEEMKHDVPETIDFDKNAEVTLAGCIFQQGLVNKIKVYRWECESPAFVWMMVDLYMDKVFICRKVFKADVALQMHYIHESLKSIDIREPFISDYQTIEGL